MNVHTNPNMNAFLHDLHRVQDNPIFFLEEYWNKLHPEMKLDLTDEEKQRIFDQNKTAVPFLADDDGLRKYQQAYDGAKKKGMKDWEIF